MHGDVDSVLARPATPAGRRCSALDGETAVGVLAFNCIGRRGILGDDGIRRGGRADRRVLGEAPFAGFYTLGEIARTRGVNAVHSQTLVALALG